ncbi:methyl-accepting chemotaxis protein [Jannaschia sp. 2305UL9-9]|uniref:methyl-accepting chemotaxis protein n=1 Tax=Jannaschia sp. 2305UL9-9 TaxID=3121638 RepID=UPI003529A64D
MSNTDWRRDPIVRLEKQIYPVLLGVAARRPDDARSVTDPLAAAMADAARSLSDIKGRVFDGYDIVIPADTIRLAQGLSAELSALSARIKAPDAADGLPDGLIDRAEEVLDHLREAFIGTVLRQQQQATQRAKIAAQEISSISRQIYFISINASVEAARAGEAGQGFAVIGEQIRSLSQDAAAALTRMKPTT